MAETSHHSIGEVLSMLKEEHPDVTISKIRFFESQGLIDPERTPSGYRKFYDGDIDRLRWILVQQRDNFLPLKVIKRRMEEEGFDPLAEDVEVDGPLPEPTLFARADDAPADEEAEAPGESAVVDEEPESEPESEPDPVVEPESEVEPEPAVEAPAVDEEPEPESDPGPEPVEVPPAAAIADGDPLDVPAGSVSLSTLELAESAGVDLGLVADLARLGLIETVAGGEGTTYDHEALVVAKAAGVFIARGVEPRHLRMNTDRKSTRLNSSH